MPFKSEKQEKYLRVHEPELAAKWARRYGSMLGRGAKKRKRRRPKTWPT